MQVSCKFIWRSSLRRRSIIERLMSIIIIRLYHQWKQNTTIIIIIIKGPVLYLMGSRKINYFLMARKLIFLSFFIYKKLILRRPSSIWQTHFPNTRTNQNRKAQRTLRGSQTTPKNQNSWQLWIQWLLPEFQKGKRTLKNERQILKIHYQKIQNFAQKIVFDLYQRVESRF